MLDFYDPTFPKYPPLPIISPRSLQLSQNFMIFSGDKGVVLPSPLTSSTPTIKPFPLTSPTIEN